MEAETNRSTHTPGPWTWFISDRDAEVFRLGEPTMKFLKGSDEQGFAHTVGLKEPRDTANARLIANAPTMLALVRRIAGGCATAGDVFEARAILRDVDGHG